MLVQKFRALATVCCALLPNQQFRNGGGTKHACQRGNTTRRSDPGAFDVIARQCAAQCEVADAGRAQTQISEHQRSHQPGHQQRH